MRILITVLLTSLVSLAPTALAYEVQTSARVVAFADVHGAFVEWVALLKDVGVVDDTLKWSGG